MENINRTDEHLSKKVFSGMMWHFFERGGIQLVNFVVQIILAILLVPEDYGIVAIVNVFIAFSNTIINNGLASAIIQKKDADEVDKNTVFYIQLGLAVILTFVLWGISPLVARIYDNPKLKQYLIVSSMVLIVEAIGALQITELKKTMQFKKSFFSNVIGTVIYGIVGTWMALSGFGVWSLIIANISMKVSTVLILCITVKWRPQRFFSWKRFLIMFSYSWKLTVAWLIGTLHQQIYTLIVGGYFSTTLLGYYSKGSHLPSTVNKMFNEIVPSVMFPALSTLQNDKDNLKKYTRKMMSITAFIICPAMAGLAAVSKNFVLLVLTDKWAASIPMMQLFCISFALNTIGTTNMQAFNAIGRSDVFMKMEMVKRGISILLVLFTARISIYAVIITLDIVSLVSIIYNAVYNSKLIGYKVKEQMNDMLPVMLISIVMFVIVGQIDNILPWRVVELFIQVVVGVVLYFLCCAVFKIQIFYEVRNLVSKKLKWK